MKPTIYIPPSAGSMRARIESQPMIGEADYEPPPSLYRVDWRNGYPHVNDKPLVWHLDERCWTMPEPEDAGDDDSGIW